MEYGKEYLERLQIELARCCGEGFYNTYKDAKGVVFTGGGEGHVKKHLTSSWDYVKGRQWKFPGIANGWNFSSAIEAAGYHIVQGKNYRGQTCSVVVKRA